MRQHSALGEIAVVAERARIRWAMARGDLDDAARRIEPLIANIEARGRQRLVAQLKLLQAMIERRRGRVERSQGVHAGGLAQRASAGAGAQLAGCGPCGDGTGGGGGEGCCAGSGVGVLCGEVGAGGACACRWATLLLQMALRPMRQARPVEPLSERERDVLGCWFRRCPTRRSRWRWGCPSIP